MDNASDTLSLNFTHSDFPEQRWAEFRFSLDETVRNVKLTLWRKVGTHPDHMRIVVDDTPVTDENLRLRDLGVKNGATLHIVDTNPGSIFKAGSEEKVEKYRISDEAYGKRPDTARKFIAALKETQPEIFSRPAQPSVDDLKDRFPLGARVRLAGDVRGEVAWVGRRPSKAAGPWVGVRLDEPFGNTSGSERGAELFATEGPKYGMFLSPEEAGAAEVGDFPPIDPFDCDEI